MAYTIEQIEDAIIAALEPLKASLGVRTIATYQGELDVKELSSQTSPLPAVYLIYGGSKYAEHGARKIENIAFDLILCGKSLRSDEDAKRGVYAMIEATRDILYASDLDLQIYPLTFDEARPLWCTRGISVYGARYKTAQALLYPAT